MANPGNPGNGSAGSGSSRPQGLSLTAKDIGARRAGTTGRYLVLLPERLARDVARPEGLRVAMSSDFPAAPPSPGDLEGADALVLEEIGVSIVVADAGKAQRFATAAAQAMGGVAALLEPERFVHAIQLGAGEGAGMPAPDYLAGYRAAVVNLVDDLLGGPVADGMAALRRGPGAEARVREDEVTWGLHAVGAVQTRYTGTGVKLAVLDTGFATGHPDYRGRTVVTQSFVPDEEVEDLAGHGTHCIGTAAGPVHPSRPPRYGIASGAEIHAGKVLSNAGSGVDGWILAGIDWAVRSGCAVVSMSLGAPAEAGEPFSRVYEQVARRALRRGTLIVAAAGNESHRPARIAAVGHPANCPSIMAVAALDPMLAVAWFSCGGPGDRGGQIDIASPGVEVYSSYPPDDYRRMDGTSMATPHVAGIACLYAEATGARGDALWSDLSRNARRLSIPSSDVGCGIAQAPA